MSALPADPLSPSGGRSMVWTGDRLTLLDHASTSSQDGNRIRIPKLDEPDDYVQSRTVVAAGRDLFVFGGARFADAESEGEPLNETSIWSPPS